MTRFALVLALVVLAGCGSSRSAAPASGAAAGAVAEAQRAVDRAAADSTQAPYLADARQSAAQAAARLAAGDADGAAHHAYLARQGARLAALQAEIDGAERMLQEADATGGQRLLVTDAFQTGRVTFTREARAAVDRVAAYLAEHPDRVALVESFTDATGSAERNLDLSIRRADAVKAVMVGAGVDEARVVAAGFGQEYPVASNDTAGDRRLNRRIEITVADRVEALPTRQPVTVE